MSCSGQECRDRALAALVAHPITGGALEVVGVRTKFPQVDEAGEPERAGGRQDTFAYGLSAEKMPPRHELEKYRVYDGHKWRLYFRAAHHEDEIGGLTVLRAFYDGVEYIFKAMVPWAGHGPFWRVTPPYVLNELQTGPAVLELEDGFIIYAGYKLGYQTVLEEFFYFDEDGNFIPFIYYTGPRPMGYIPIYLDFDIDGPLDNSAAVYHPQAIERWNQIVTEFESTEARIGIPARHDRSHRLMNVLLFNQRTMESWVEAFVNPHDEPDQYVSLRSTYDVMEHPRVNNRGRVVVSVDLVYPYVIRNARPGLYGPRFTMKHVAEATWPFVGGDGAPTSVAQCPGVTMAGSGSESG